MGIVGGKSGARLGFALVLTAAQAGCGGARETPVEGDASVAMPTPSAAGASSRVDPGAALDTRDARDASAALDAIRARFVVRGRPVIARGGRARFEPLAGDGDRVRVHPEGPDVVGSTARAATLELPGKADGVVHVEDEKSHAALDFQLVGAASTPGRFADGLAIYPHALREEGTAAPDAIADAAMAGTIVQRPTADGTEDFVVFARRPAREELRYRVAPSGVASLRLVGGALEALDAKGAPRLRVGQPYVVDAGGVQRAAAIGVEGCAFDTDPAPPWGRPHVAVGAARCEIVVRWSGDGLAYPVIVDPAWVTTGSMAVARQTHAASLLLTSARVLVSAGWSGSGNLSSAELYDVATGTWAMTGSLAGARNGHTSTALLDGGALVVGGGGLSARTAERFNATTGTWGLGGVMNEQRFGASATRLQDGNVVVAGGYSATGTLLSDGEYFVKDSNAWGSVSGTMNYPRAFHTGTLLSSGRVLLAGGDGCSSADYFLPGGAGSFGFAGNFASGVRADHQAVLLSDGRVVIHGGTAGGGSTTAAALASSEIFNGAGSWGPGPTETIVGRGRTATLLAGDKILLVGGLAGSTALSTAERLDVATGTFAVAGVPTARYRHTATLLGTGKVLVVGGVGVGGAALKTADLYQGPQALGATCTGAYDCTGGICRDGVCCDGACTGTCQACDAAGHCAGVKAADDADSCSGASTCDAAGVCKKKLGQGCTLPTECASGNCADGMCCNTACAGACDACVAGACTIRALGAAGAPSCSPLVCDGTGAACPAACASDAQCASGFYCAADGTCKAVKATGAACNLAAGGDCKQPSCRACPSLNCVDGVCCASACGAACDVCAKSLGATSDGTCTTAPLSYAGIPACAPFACNGTSTACPPTCVSDAQCAAGNYCAPGGLCKPQKAKGAACNAAAGVDCLEASCRVCGTPGGCVDGVCCDTACAGACDACSVAAGASANGTCALQSKGSAGAPSCAPFRCDGASSACGTKCVVDGDCTAGAYCAIDGTCKADQPNGGACDRTAQCASGFCADGVCCSSACTGLCQACSAALKTDGSIAGNGTCGPAKTGTDPHAQCSADPSSTCQQDGQCDGAGGCRLWPAKTSCGATQCAAGDLVKGQICDGFGGCQPETTGVPCAPRVCSGGGCKSPCAADADCVAGYFCNGADCVAKQPQGAACSSARECGSGYCVDGICCGSACQGLCQACVAAKKASGDLDGTCGPAAAGTDPHADCPDEGAPGCDRDGQCDGVGQCRTYAAGTPCLPIACTGDATSGFQKTAYQCDGSGTCAAKTLDSCGDYRCATGACKTTCATDVDCVASAYCAAGACVARGANGVACGSGSECASGICADGLCCDSPCGGECEACDVAGAKGRCVPVVGAPHGSRTACPGASAGAPCSERRCDGVDRATCSGFVGSELECRSASCAVGVATTAARCDGKGICPSATTAKCEPYVCAGAACGAAPCATDADCAGKFRCDVAQHDCIARETSTCADVSTQSNPDGTTTACAPYRCDGNACRGSCRDSSDCLSGFLCDATQGQGTCITPPGANTESSGGCSAGRAAPRGAAETLGGLGLVAALVALGRARTASTPRRARTAKSAGERRR